MGKERKEKRKMVVIIVRDNSDRSMTIDQLFQGTCLEDPRQIGDLVERLQDDEGMSGFVTASGVVTSGSYPVPTAMARKRQLPDETSPPRLTKKQWIRR